MYKSAALLFALLTVSLSPAFANLASIHADRLPQETAILAALDDAKQLEPYSRSWTNNWKYPVSKEDAATGLGKDLGFLTIALKSHSDNPELLLLTGLVARYAYNVDVPGSHEAAISALEQAQKLAPSDVRAPWFHAMLLCQTNQSMAGAEEMLVIEGGHTWNSLPIAFWDDYLECATIANLPAHVLRAADHLEKLHAPSTEVRTAVTEATRKRYDAFDPKREYQPKEVWEGTNDGENPDFTSTTCGVRLRARGDWRINQLAVTNGSCVAYFSTGPYKATARDLRPSVLLLVKQPEGNQTLGEFVRKLTKNDAFEPFTISRCPAASCIAMKGVQ
ncbi:MAG: hypothetical protein WBQ94_09005, partial [Terracidiphilus sp.]